MKKRLGKLSIVLVIVAVGCANSLSLFKKEAQQRDYREDMRNFVITLSVYAKNINPIFAVVPQNGIELVTDNGAPNGRPSVAYLNAIDGHGQESLFFGYSGDNKKTPQKATEYTSAFLNLSKEEGNAILVTDYCSSKKKMKESISSNAALGYASFVAQERNLIIVPNILEVTSGGNKRDINTLQEAENILYLINYENFEDKKTLLLTIQKTNYDILILDLFFNDGTSFTFDDVNTLKIKANGGKRQVICYMSIGEAEDYRYYWNPDWDFNKPEWLDKENKNWKGNYKVKYWDKDWQKIILGEESSYLDKILEANFDGVYLDIIDGFEYFENI